MTLTETMDHLGETSRAGREGAAIWLHARNGNLGGRRPVDVLAEGRLDDVRAEVERLVSEAW